MANVIERAAPPGGWHRGRRVVVLIGTAAPLVLFVAAITFAARSRSADEFVYHVGAREPDRGRSGWVVGVSRAGETGWAHVRVTPATVDPDVLIGMMAPDGEAEPGWHVSRQTAGSPVSTAGQSRDGVVQLGRFCVARHVESVTVYMVGAVTVDVRWTTVPTWAVVVASGGWASLSALAWWRHRHRRWPGHCRRCGYDLRASPGRCPECGAAAAGGFDRRGV